jgi:hypothetical protein
MGPSPESLIVPQAVKNRKSARKQKPSAPPPVAVLFDSFAMDCTRLKKFGRGVWLSY